MFYKGRKRFILDLRAWEKDFQVKTLENDIVQKLSSDDAFKEPEKLSSYA